MTAKTRRGPPTRVARSSSVGLPPGPWDDDWEPDYDDAVEDDDAHYGRAEFEQDHRRHREAEADDEEADESEDEDEAEHESGGPLIGQLPFVPLKLQTCSIVGCTPNTPCVFCK